MSIGVSQEAVNYLNSMAQSLTELSIQIHSITQSLKEVFEENKDGLGAHSADIQRLLDELEQTEQEASDPVKKLVLKLTRASAVRRQHIDTQRYSGRSR